MAILGSLTQLDILLGLQDQADGQDELQTIRKNGSFFLKVKFGLFGVLSLLLRKRDAKEGSIFRVYTLSTINMLQLLAFTFSTNNGFPFPEWISNTIVPVVQTGNLVILTQSSELVASVVFVLCLGLLSATFGAVGCIAYQFAQDKINQLWLLRPLGIVLRALTTYLYVPTLAVLLMIYSCSDGNNKLSSLFTCNTTIHTISKIITGGILVIFIAFTCIAVLVLIDRNPQSKSPTAKAHGRVDCFSLVLRAALSVVLTVYQGTASVNLCASAVASVALSLFCANIYYLPFYNMKVNKISVGFLSVFLWSAVCLLTELVVTNSFPLSMENAERYSSVSMFLIGSPFVFYSAIGLVELRVEYLQVQPQSLIKSPLIMELMLRIKYPSDENKWEDLKEIYRDIVDQQMSTSGFFNLHLASLLELENNVLLSGQFIRVARGLNLWLDEQFFVFVYNLEQESRDVGVEGNALNFMAFDHHRTESVKKLLASMEVVHKIWTRLAAKHANVQTLLQFGVKLRNASSKAHFHLEELLRLTNTSPPALRLYSFFCEFVMNDRQSARALEIRADEIEYQEAMGDSNEQTNWTGKDNMHSEPTATLAGSGNNIGEILDVSKKLCSLFGYTQDDLVGNKVNMLCPPPFDEMHDMFLHRYIENNTEFVRVERHVWGLHADGYVIPMNLTIYPSVVEGDLIFSGIFTVDSDFHDKFVMLSMSGQIMFASQSGWTDVVGLTGTDGGEYHLSDILNSDELSNPGLKRILSGEDCDRIRIEIRGEVHEVSSKMFNYNVNVRGMQGNNLEMTLVTFGERPSMMPENDGPLASSAMRGRLDSKALPSFSPTMSTPKPLGNDEKGSVGSRSTVNMKAMKLHHSVLKVVERAIARSKNRLARFQVFYLISTVFCLAFAFTEYGSRKVRYSDGLESVQRVYASTERTNLITGIALALKTRNIVQNDLSGNFSQHLAHLDLEIGNNMKLLTNIHDTLSVEKTATESSFLQSLNTDRAVEIMTTSAVSETTIPGHTSLWAAIHDFISSVKVISEKSANITATASCDRSCLFVLENGPNSLFTASLTATKYYADYAVNTLQNIETFMKVSMGLAVGVSFLCLVLVLIPAVVQAWATQARISNAIISISATKAGQLAENTGYRYRHMKRYLLGEEHDDQMDAQERRNTLAAIQKTAMADDESSKKVHIMRGATLNRASPKAKPNLSTSKQKQLVQQKKLTKRQMIRVTAIRLKLYFWAFVNANLLLGWPYLFTIGYFGISSAVEMSLMQKRIDQSRFVHYAGKRWVQALNLQISVQEITFEPEAHSHEITTERLAAFVRSHMTLVYNYTSNTLDQANTSILEERYVTDFRYACEDTCKSHPDLLASTVLETGLHLASKNFAESVQKILDDPPNHGETNTSSIAMSNYYSSRAMDEALQKSTLQYLQDLQNLADKHQAFGRSMLLCYIFVLLASVWISYQSFYKMHEKVLNMQFLLLLIPKSTLQNVPALKALFVEMGNNDL